MCTRLALGIGLMLFVPILFAPILDAKDKDKVDPAKKKGLPMVDGLKALKHEDAKVRYRAVQTLAEVGPLAKFAVPNLRELLKDPHPLVRVKTAEALWKIEQTPGSILLPVLLAALKDKNAGVRAAAPPVIALMGSKAKNALPALGEALQDKDFEVKLAAVVALGELGPVAKEQANDLLATTSDKDFFLLEPFVGASLGNLGESVVPALTEALAEKSGERRRVAAYALGSMGSAAASASLPLAKALHDNDPATRKHAVRALGRIGAKAKESLPQVERATTDKESTVRIEAALAAWSISGTPKHIGVLITALGDKSPNVRDAACQALAVMKADARDAADPLMKLLGDKDLRTRAIITLGELGPVADKSLPDLKKLMDDKDGETQLLSAFAVWQISGSAKESLALFEKMLGVEKHDKQAIQLLGDMRDAAQSVLPTLVAMYREEEDFGYRQTLAVAIKKIDPKAGALLGIR